MHETERRTRTGPPLILPAPPLQRRSEGAPADAFQPQRTLPEIQVVPAIRALTLDLARSPVTAQRRAARPTLTAAELSRDDQLAVQRCAAHLSVQRQALSQSRGELDQRGLTPAPLHLLERHRPAPEAVPQPLTPTDWQERTRAAQQDVLAVLNRDARALPFHQRAELVCHTIEAARTQGLEADALRQHVLSALSEPMQRDTLEGLFLRQDTGRLIAHQNREAHALLLNHAQLQRAVDQAQTEHEALSQHSALERVQARRGQGSPLPEDVRGQLELGLNHDLSAVRVHTDDEADRVARSLHAVAFTSGTDIYFQMGEYNPASKLELLAHEVAHVKQQDRGQVGLGVDPDAGLESEAQKFGEEFALGQAGSVSPKVRQNKKLVPTISTPATAGPQLAVQRKATPTQDFWFAPKWTHQFSGTLGASHITMTLMRVGEVVSGSYQYQGHSGHLRLSGKISSTSNMATLTELDVQSPEGTPGTAALVLAPETSAALHGAWRSAGQELPMALTLADVAQQPPEQKPEAGQVNPAVVQAVIHAVISATSRFDTDQRPPAARVQEMVPRIVAEAVKHGITDPAQLAVMLANASHESRFDPTVSEGMSYSTPARILKIYSRHFKTLADTVPYLNNPEKLANRVYANEDGNGSEASGDGWTYRGRGLVQITHRGAYRRLTTLLRGKITDTSGQPYDFERHPDQVAEIPPSVAALVQGVAQGAFTQKGTMADFLQAHPKRDATTFTLARRKFVGNADASVVGAVTAAIYQMIKDLAFVVETPTP